MSDTAAPSHRACPLWLVAVVVFVNGGVVMAMELAGSRVLAPYLGSSLYVWTSLIGVILASLSIGNYAGGSLADRDFAAARLSTARVASMFLVGAASLALMVLLEAPASHFAATSISDLRLATVVASVILFCAPSFVLGMVSPYLTRIALAATDAPGRVVGAMSSLSTAGCIFGTFVTGFILLESLGTVRLILTLACVLAFLGLLLGGVRLVGIGITVLTMAGALAADSQKLDAAVGGESIATEDTRYSRVRILEWKEDNRTLRALSTDPFVVQSVIDVDRPNEGIGVHYDFFDLFESMVPGAKHALVLGGGAYTYPRKLIARNQKLSVDVVEIDPGITALAKKFFFLAPEPRMKIFHQDARLFLSQAERPYDVIFQDTFNAGFSLPFHLATVEFYQALVRDLAPEGVLFINFISAVEGEGAGFFEALVSSVRTVLPVVRAIKAIPERKPSEAQNIGLIAARSESAFSAIGERLKGAGIVDLTNVARTPLTDDLAPVDRYALAGYRTAYRR